MIVASSRFMAVNYLMLAVLTATVGERAWACASCGSGGDSPLVLYPNEAVKAYVGVSRQAGFKTVTAEGRVGTDLGPETKDTVVAAFGASFLTDGFTTLTVPYVTNEREGRRSSGAGDPLLSINWTIVPASIAKPTMPQIQILTAYRRSAGKSVETSDDDNFLDVYGTGFDEARLGIDCWWGGAAIKAGFAVVATHPFPKTLAGAERAPGNGVRGTVTAGYGFHDVGKIIGGALVERDGERRDGDAAISGSSVATNMLFAGADADVGKNQTIRMTIAKAAAFGQNRNTTVAQAWTVAWMGSL